MNAPRLEIDLEKIYHNAHTLVERLGDRGISVTGVTKATLGSREIANSLLRAGVSALGDARIENIEAMCLARVPAPMTLIRAPMLSQVDRVIAHADMSFNTELETIKKLSLAGKLASQTHAIVLMAELGDLREGIMPDDLIDTVRQTVRLPNILFKGIGTNLACRSGVSPDSNKMAQLSALAESIEATVGVTVDIVSGGNSANLTWALSGADPKRINDLRLGESILLGREPLRRQPIEGLFTDAITLSAEVIESKLKPSQPWGTIAQSAFGEQPPVTDRGTISQTILALGLQDTDICGLQPSRGIEIKSASSDHLILESSHCHPIGDELVFQPNYSALVHAMTSPFVTQVVKPPSIGMEPHELTVVG